MTRSERVRLIFWLTVLVLTVGAFAAERLLVNEVCVSGIVTDQMTTTYLGEVCS